MMFCANILLYMNIHEYQLRKGRNQTAIASYMEAITLWMLCCFLLTEGLSFFHGMNRISLGICWLVIDLLLLACWLKQRGKQRGQGIACYFPLRAFAENKLNWCLAVIGTVVLALALMTVPYNWDSMTYRLPRIAYWAQNGSVEHFATNCTRALSNPPLGEFVQLHIYVMTGRSDLFLNLLQAASYLTCTVMVYAIAKRLQCNKTFCFLATLLFMSMPIAFAEAINTQVDLFSSVWLLIFVYLLMDFVESRKQIVWCRENIFKVCIMGLCVAWGYLSKPNVCVAMVLFAVWLLINCIVRKDKIGVLFRLAMCALASMLIPIGWEVSRNLQTYHAISAPISGARQLVGTLAPNYLIINLLKNLTYNLPCEMWGRMTEYMMSFMWQLSNLLGVPLNAEVIAEDGRQFAYMAVPNYGHDTATNLIIVWLLIICIVWVIVCICKVNWKKLYQSYSLVAVTAFFVFCTILRWEPFVTRYMISFLALLCPAIASILQKRTGGNAIEKKGNIKTTICGYVVVGFVSILCLLDVVNMAAYHWNISADMGGGDRPYGYFVNRSTEYESTIGIVEYIKNNGYRELGFYHGEDDYEYPYWALLGEDVDRIEHVGVTNESAIYVDKEYTPQCIIWHGALPVDTFVWNGQEYSNVIEIVPGRYVLTSVGN